jgi:serine/threonine protein kinase
MSTDLLTNGSDVRGTVAAYRILNLIGRGGMGAVYRVQRLADGTIWALKEMRPLEEVSRAEASENRELFVQEGQLLGSLEHPALPVLAEAFEWHARPVLVMEYVPGHSLEAMLTRAAAPMPEQQALGYAIQLADVLHYLHTRPTPVIYRDLKPPNAIVTPEGIVKLLDFGVARLHKRHKTKDTVAMGSAGYAPPEQYGSGQTDARSDVYALGATLLHLLTNLPPVPLSTPTAGSIVALNRSVAASTEQVIIRAMQLSADQRFQSAHELGEALRRCYRGTYDDPYRRAPAPPPRIPPASPAAETRAQPVVRGDAPTEAAPSRCPQCRHVIKPQARFCAHCGARLAQGGPVVVRIISPRGVAQQQLDRLPASLGRRDPARQHFPDIDLAERDRGLVSRSHARIERQNGHLVIIDVGSKNGTRVNGTMLVAQQAHPLRTGDRVRIGEVEIEVVSS